MKKLATLFQDSYNELKHVRTVTTIAMFASIGIILGSLTVQIGDFIKIGFSSIANQFVFYRRGHDSRGSLRVLFLQEEADYCSSLGGGALRVRSVQYDPWNAVAGYDVWKGVFCTSAYAGHQEPGYVAG